MTRAKIPERTNTWKRAMHVSVPHNRVDMLYKNLRPWCIICIVWPVHVKTHIEMIK